jgi:hypothetical protein
MIKLTLIFVFAALSINSAYAGFDKASMAKLSKKPLADVVNARNLTLTGGRYIRTIGDDKLLCTWLYDTRLKSRNEKCINLHKDQKISNNMLELKPGEVLSAIEFSCVSLVPWNQKKIDMFQLCIDYSDPAVLYASTSIITRNYY